MTRAGMNDVLDDSSIYGLPRLTIDVDIIASPEGTILNKLEWYRMGGEVSDRQWNDILGVLKVQGTHLDMDYLKKWAAYLKVTDLLERALVDAGLED